MSSASVVLHAGLNDQNWHMQLNKMIRNKDYRDVFSEVEHQLQV